MELKLEILEKNGQEVTMRKKNTLPLGSIVKGVPAGKNPLPLERAAREMTYQGRG